MQLLGAVTSTKTLLCFVTLPYSVSLLNSAGLPNSAGPSRKLLLPSGSYLPCGEGDWQPLRLMWQAYG